MFDQPFWVSSRKHELSKMERRIFSFAEQDPLRFATSTALEIAQLTSTSEATVSRAARKLGFASTKEMKQSCASRVDHSQSLGVVIRSRLGALPQDEPIAGPQVTANAVLASAAELLMKLSDGLDTSTAEQTIRSMLSVRRILVYGLGTAYFIAQYFTLELERIGLQALSLTGSGHSIADAVPRVHPDDMLIVLAPLRLFPDIRKFIWAASERTDYVALITQDSVSEKLPSSTISLDLPNTTGGPASESVAVWALCDVLLAEIARQQPERAIEARNEVLELRDHFSSS